MATIARFIRLFVSFGLVLACAAPVWAGDAVEFSGEVKKVVVEKNKVAVADPATKKQFTLTLDGNTRLSGLEKAGDLKKGDKISGKYVVTQDGAYVASELSRK